MKKIILYISLILAGPHLYAQNQAVGIDTIIRVQVGGIIQVISLKGKNRADPILLYLHGASAGTYSLISNAGKISSRLQEHFVVALWDQRNYGKTLEANPSGQRLTVSLLGSDAEALVDYLLEKFNRRKLYIAAHSMGCVMGIHIAQQNPQHLAGLILISPPVNGMESQRLALDTLKRYFQQVHNQRAVQELSAIRLPARDFESLFIRYIWQTEYDGEHITGSAREEIRPILKQWMGSPAAALSDEVFELNFFRQYPRISCPVYFFVGRKDLMTNASVTERYFQQLNCPRKRLFWFEHSAHAIPDTEGEKMQDLIIGQVLPAAKKGENE